MLIGSGEEGEAQMKSVFKKAQQFLKATFPEYFDTSMIDSLEKYTDPKLYFKYAFTVGERRRCKVKPKLVYDKAMNCRFAT